MAPYRWHQPDEDYPTGSTSEIYNLGAQSHVAVNFESPEYRQ